MKLVTVVGARPQFIKAATVSRALKAQGFKESLVHTGQHYNANMSEVFFEELDIPKPRYNLGIGSGLHGAQTGQMLAGIENVLLKEKPHALLVYGDTNSTLAGALAATKLHIPVVHIEAGLRSFNRRMPEEVNRVLTDHISEILFAPTNAAVENLLKEGVADTAIHQVGDVMYDAALYYSVKAERKSQILSNLGLEPKTYVLATVHRAENTDDVARLNTIFEAFAQLAESYTLVLPLHPRTQAALKKAGLQGLLKNLKVTSPLGYLDMVMLERGAQIIVTDSGGVQKEAYFQNVPCVTLRDETEWLELLNSGWNTLAPPHSAQTITAAVQTALSHFPEAKPVLYGDGNAAGAMVKIMQDGLADKTPAV